MDGKEWVVRSGECVHGLCGVALTQVPFAGTRRVLRRGGGSDVLCAYVRRQQEEGKKKRSGRHRRFRGRGFQLWRCYQLVCRHIASCQRSRAAPGGAGSSHGGGGVCIWSECMAWRKTRSRTITLWRRAGRLERGRPLCEHGRGAGAQTPLLEAGAGSENRGPGTLGLGLVSALPGCTGLKLRGFHRRTWSKVVETAGRLIRIRLRGREHLARSAAASRTLAHCLGL